MSLFRPDQSVAAIPSSIGGQMESANLTMPDPGGDYEVQTIVASIVSGAAQGDFVIVSNADGVTTAIWIDIDADGTEPAGILYTAATNKIEVDVLGADTAIQAAAKINTAIAAIAGFTPSVNGATITLTATKKGNCTAPVRKNAAEDGNGSFVVATTVGGVAPTLQGKYVLVNNGSTTFSMWFSSNGNGSDPAVASTTAVEVALLGAETASGAATLLAAGIEAQAGLHAEADGDRVIITGDANANLADVTAGDSGATLEYRAQGQAKLLAPDSAVVSMTPTPSAY